MEIIYIPRKNLTEAQQTMLKDVEKSCFGILDYETKNNEEGHHFGAIELGAFSLINNDKIVGCAYVYKRLTEYDGQKYYIGGFGGLAVMPEYQGNGYARQLAEKATKLSYDIGVDVACLFTSRDETVYKLYEKLGFIYLNRRGYYLNSLHKEAFRDDIMILGLNNKEIARKILTTNHRFHYGKEEGCW